MARAERQRQGKFLRDSFSDIDRVPLERFKGGLVDTPVDLVLLLAHRSINQQEAVRNAARYRVQSDRSILHELGLECRLQQNGSTIPATKLDHGRQPIESEEVEALRQLSALVGGCLDALAKGRKTESGNPNEPREFRYDLRQDLAL